ncbi:methylmalonyl-CoA mutase [Chlorobium phaeovibrioides]|uniref:Methylmalonyl-CoA mutase n=1 Tax=Chlorobium phaeovibrioides TaxID=1094 RepID=A0A5M8IEA1_CHLPH|nr:methylmalonyl-CoA mutase family protein [Chlorobium phaeovibrioides]KAA6232722.1 methylmalonyl-CoA mutase [Chlorobium phaeovibrioides]
MTHSPPALSFSEFPPISQQEWQAKAEADLKTTPYGRIVWNTPDGFQLEPWYSTRNSATQIPVPPKRNTGAMHSCRRILVRDFSKANSACLEALREGATALELFFTDPLPLNPAIVDRMMENIDTALVPIWFSGAINHAALLGMLVEIEAFESNRGGLLTPAPLSCPRNEIDRLHTGTRLPEFHTISIDTVPFHEEGATAALEIALALAGASDALNRLSHADIPAAGLTRTMVIIMAAGTSHFTELAKPRAFRALFGHIQKAYGDTSGTTPALFARTSRLSSSVLDPYTNLLRLTTQTLSSMLGGYGTLQMEPFEGGLTTQKDAANETTACIPLILGREAGLDETTDPAEGSPFIETLTTKLAQKAWELFTAIEAEGGLLKAIESGTVAAMTAERKQAQSKELRNRKATIIGVNRYPAELSASQQQNREALLQAVLSAPAASRTAPFELLRLQAEGYRAEAEKTPSVFIWMAGDKAISRRQAAFAEDFFLCGGFTIAGEAHLTPDENSVATALFNGPAIVVLCMADNEKAAAGLISLLKTRNPEIIPVMAGRPPENHANLLEGGLDSFIYTGVDVAAMLEAYHRKTGIQ